MVLTRINLRNWQQIAHWGAIACLFVALFAGRFSFDRFFSASFIGAEFLQLRIWFTALAGVLAFASRDFRKALPIRDSAVYLIPFLGLQCCFALNVVLLQQHNAIGTYLLDLFFIVLSSGLIAWLFRSKDDLKTFAVVSELIGIVLFLFCLAGFGDPTKWSPFGSVITFYHIEFLTFCGALWLAHTVKNWRWTLLHGAIGIVGLFSALATSSKAAVIGALVMAIYIIFWLLSAKEYKKTLFTAVALILAFASYGVLRASYVGDRFAVIANSASNIPSPVQMSDKKEGGQGGGESLPLAYPYDVLRDIYAGKKVEFADLNEEQQALTRSFWELTKYAAPDYRRNLQAFLEFTSTRILLQDGTTRLQMAMAAWEIFLRNKWIGVGIGNYRDFGANSGERTIEIYRHPHNIVLEVLATTGLVGGAFFFCVILLCMILLQQQILESPAVSFLMAYLLACFVTALFSGDYYDFRLFWYVALISFSSLGIERINYFRSVK